MDLAFNTTDTAALAAMQIPQYAEDVAKPDTPATDPATPASDAPKPDEPKQAVKEAPAGPTKADLEAVVAAEEAERKSGEADKEHNFALLRAAVKRLEGERDEALRIANESKAAGEPKLDAPPDLAAIDAQIKALREQATKVDEQYPDMDLGKGYLISADTLAAMRARMAYAERVVAETERAQRERAEAAEKDELAVAQEKADALIASDPVLSHWKQHDQASYDLAAEQDEILRKQPAWQNVPFEKRFAHVVEIVKTLNPEASMPAAKPGDPQKPAPKTPEKAAPAKESAAAPIRSLSDVPGGVPAAATELENIAELPAAVLGNKFQKMTREQQDAFLSSLAV